MAESTTGSTSGSHRAGLFDIRFVIAALIGIYGIITLLTGLFVSDAQVSKSDGMNINLIGGIGMIIVAIGFASWARLRPIVVPGDTHTDTDSGSRPAGH